MNKLLVFLICLPALALAQNYEGIRFENYPGWQKVLAEAKAQHRYIFVDAYATWCGPCKKMRAEVFPQKQVGDDLNPKFLSISVQMDATKADSPQVKAWYADAQALAKEYKITGFPTLLYFSPQGKLINKVTDSLDAQKFIAAAADALEYDRRSKDYLAGKLKPDEWEALAHRAKQIGDNAMAGQVAANRIRQFEGDSKFSDPNLDFAAQFTGVAHSAGEVYGNDYAKHLKSLGAKEAFTKKNLGYMRAFTRSSKDEGFDLFYRHRYEIEQAAGTGDTGYAVGVVDWIIRQEEVFPAIKAQTGADESSPKVVAGAAEPDWKKIKTAIAAKYSEEYAGRTVAIAQVDWHWRRKDWPGYGRYLAAYFKNWGNEILHFNINIYGWEMFLNCTDPNDLRTVAEWMEEEIWSGSVPQNQANQIEGDMDTCANLFYRAGDKDKAVKWETAAVNFMKAQKEQAETKKAGSGSVYDQNIKVFDATLAKMKQGLPTWTQG